MPNRNGSGQTYLQTLTNLHTTQHLIPQILSLFRKQSEIEGKISLIRKVSGGR